MAKKVPQRTSDEQEDKHENEDKHEEIGRLSFEQALENLERVVRRLEDGSVGLSEALAEYERGIKYLRQCHRRLEAAERKIELLVGLGEQDEARTVPFDVDEENSAGESDRPAGRRPTSRRRGGARRDEDHDDGPPALF